MFVFHSLCNRTLFSVLCDVRRSVEIRLQELHNSRCFHVTFHTLLRYQKIVKPYSKQFSLRTTKVALAVAVGGGLLFCLPETWVHGLMVQQTNQVNISITYCMYDVQYALQGVHYHATEFVAVLLGTGILTVFYITMAIQFSRQQTRTKALKCSRTNRKRKTLLMFFIISLVATLTLIPMCVVLILAVCDYTLGGSQGSRMSVCH